MNKDFPKDINYKPWVLNLIKLFYDWQARGYPDFPPYIFWNISGGEEFFEDLGRLKTEIKKSHPFPSVYYIGMGNISRLNLDLIYPLLITDFSKLVAVDIEPREEGLFFEKFIQSVTLNLAMVDEIEQSNIAFEKISEKRFGIKFLYEDRERELDLSVQFDATKNFPEKLKNGYDILFTRRANSLFWKNSISSIPEAVKDEFAGLLKIGGIAIFQEIVGDRVDFKKRIKEQKEWLGRDFKLCFASRATDSLSEKLTCFKKIR